MSYQLPLTERIRIQFEILCENLTDCFTSLSSSYKRPMFFFASCALFLTLRSARRSINKAKAGGALGTGGYGYGSSTGGYGSSSLYGSSSSLTGGGSSLYGGYGSGSTGGLMGGASSSTYGMRGAGTSMGSASYGASSYGSSMGSSLGGSSFGSTMGGGGGKGTADLVDSNPSGVITLDPTIKFQNYGGSASFYGQIEVIQAFDAPSFVSQILSQPGGSKVLVIDGGGSLNSALFDAQMANTAMSNGWKGVLVHGAVRNVAKLSTISIGVKAVGTSPMKGMGANGQRGAGINIGSTQLQSGLWLYSDGDGIVLSQSDISGGSFGGGGGGGGGAMLGGSMGSSFGSTGGYGGSTSSYGSGMGSTSYGGTPSLTGGYGSSSSVGSSGYGASSSLTGGYGGSTSSYGTGSGSMGSTYGSSLTGYSGSTTMGGSTYGTSGSSLTGGYGSSSTNTMGGSAYGYGSSSPYSYGRSSYSTKRKKHKMFKVLLATSIAAVVWIVCLR